VKVLLEVAASDFALIFLNGGGKPNRHLLRDLQDSAERENGAGGRSGGLQPEAETGKQQKISMKQSE
jgi:hypothetical protein